MHAIIVRATTVADLPGLARLWHDKMVLQQQYDRRFTLMPDAPEHWANTAAGWLPDPNFGAFSAAAGAELLGYIFGRVEPGPPGLLPAHFGSVIDVTINLHVHQGGVGGRLLVALKRWFADRNVQDIVAYVPRRAMVEQAFWRAQGAVEWIDLMWIK